MWWPPSGETKRGAEGALPAPRFGLNGFVIARDSEKEARDTLREIVEKAHKPAVEGFRAAVQEAGASTKDGKGMWADSSFEDLVQYNDGFKTQLIGTPEQIAERIVEYKKIGVNLFLTGYLHFQEEVAAFGAGHPAHRPRTRSGPGPEERHRTGPVPDPGRCGRHCQQAGERVMADRKFGFRTRALHAGGTPDAEHGARAVPIYQTTSFVFKDTQDAANLFALQKYGNIYSRIGNPTVAAFEERIASLEGGIGAVATSSGMAAEFITFAALTQSGDHIVAASQLYGGTVTQLDVTLRRFGVDTTFVPGTDPADYAAAVRENTKAIFVEVVANPSSEVQDLEGLAKVAHDAGIPLVVDATLSTPYLVRPIEHGADIVIHSATKFLGGHGTTLGGVIVESGRFNWGNGKFPTMTEPVASYGNVSWWGNFGEYGFLTKLRCEQLRDIGPALSPQSAFQLLQGVETLPQRLDEHLRNAQAVAEWLEADERVAYVNFSGLPSHPHFERARKYLPLGPGSVFSFGVKGGRAAGQKFIESLQLASHLANVGDSRTLVIHPGSTTHQQLSPEQLESAGVPEDLVRISIGLEDIEDILWDLDQALDAASGATADDVSAEAAHRAAEERGGVSKPRRMHRRPTPARLEH